MCSVGSIRSTQGFFIRTAKTDQTGQMPMADLSVCWAQEGLILLVLSCGGSIMMAALLECKR